jgi:CarD family transcriptional regulator
MAAATTTAFAIGSRVVHPHHGAGIVTKVAAKTIGDRSHRYYIIETTNMELMVPVSGAQGIGLRRVRGLAQLRQALRACCRRPSPAEIGCDHRVRKATLSEDLKTGSFEQAVHAARILYYLKWQRPLGIIDTQLYQRAISLIASEFALAARKEIHDAEAEIERQLARMRETECPATAAH